MSPTFRMMVTTTPYELSTDIVEGRLYQTLAVERFDDLIPATHEHLLQAKVSLATAWEEAMSDLRRNTSPADLRRIDTMPGMNYFTAEDGTASARLVLLPSLLRPVPLGGVVVSIPAVDQLLAVPLHSARALDSLQILASALGHALDTVEQPLSDQLFWWDGDRWTALTVVHGDDEVTVLPTPAFVRTMNRLAAMDLVRVAGEA